MKIVCKFFLFAIVVCGISFDRDKDLADRLSALIDENVAEPSDANGTVIGLCGAIFQSPQYMQVEPTQQSIPTPVGEN